MKYQRPALIAGGVLAFGLATAWMIPPTKPLGGAVVNANEHGFRPVQKAAVPAPTPTIANASYTSLPQPAPEQAHAQDGDSGPDATGGRQPIVVRVPAPPPVIPPALRRGSQDYASADQLDGDRAFRAGYRWAEENEAQDRQDCRNLPPGPGEAGCRAYLSDQRDRDDAGGDPAYSRW